MIHEICYWRCHYNGAAAAIVAIGFVLYVTYLAPSERVSTRRIVKSWSAVASEGHLVGSPSAPVKIVGFFDYECPFCRKLKPVLEEVRLNYPNDVAIVYRHFPLAGHPNAKPAAVATVCAARENRFLPFHSLLFNNHDRLSDASWEHYAGLAGVSDLSDFKVCIQQEEVFMQVQRDVQVGRRLGINGIPTLLINNVLVSGALSFDELDQLIQEQLDMATEAERSRY